MGSIHARSAMANSRLDLVAVYDPRSAALGQFPEACRKESVRHFFATSMDFCVIAVPSASHKEVTVQAVGANLPSLIEKPLATSVSDAKEILGLYQGAGIAASVGHIERFNPALVRARIMIESGAIGDILHIVTRRLSQKPERIRDVGVLLDLGSHDFDITAWLTSSRLAVCGAAIRFDDQGVDTFASCAGQVRPGVSTSHLLSWHSPEKERSVEILGTEGVLQLDLAALNIRWSKSGVARNQWEVHANIRGPIEGERVEVAFDRTEPATGQHLAFISQLEGQSTNLASLEEGLAAVECAESAIQLVRSS